LTAIRPLLFARLGIVSSDYHFSVMYALFWIRANIYSLIES
jgi:hypothetical protein